jgi:hypothetical protein
VIERERGVIRFRHPLLLSVLYNDLGVRRRIVHRRIAVVVDDLVIRSRHLALATDEPDADRPARGLTHIETRERPARAARSLVRLAHEGRRGTARLEFRVTKMATSEVRSRSLIRSLVEPIPLDHAA